MKDDEPVVTHIETGEVIPAHKTGDKWRIATGGKSKYRYFTDEQIATAELRRKPAAIPQEEQNRTKETTWRQSSFSIVFIQGTTKHDTEAYSNTNCLLSPDVYG